MSNFSRKNAVFQVFPLYLQVFQSSRAPGGDAGGGTAAGGSGVEEAAARLHAGETGRRGVPADDRRAELLQGKAQQLEGRLGGQPLV